MSYVGDDPNCPPVKDVFGLLKVCVLAPKKLFLPVLPYHLDGKNMFFLCLACATEQNQHTCTHSVKQRAFKGTYVSTELQIALQKGYKVLKVYDVLHFPKKAQYNKETKEGGIWTPFVNYFLRLKQQASGFPAGCKTQEDKQEYIKSYREREGIQLNESEIEYNETRRTVSKLFLNSCWVYNYFFN